MSTNTGIAPILAMEPAVEKKVYGEAITRSPGPIPALIKDMSRASVPEETPTAYLD